MRLFRKFLYLLVAIVLVVTLASCGNEDGDGSSYTISFDTNGGIKINDQVVDWDKNPELPTPTRTGYTFAGWFLDSKLTKPLTTNFNFTESITVYAKWTVNKYKVTFMLDEETLYREIEKEYQSVATVEVPEKKNYSFVDWYLDKELTQPFDGYVSANDITVYAKFEANSMMVSFSSPHSASTQKMNGVTLTWGGNTKLPANTFTRPGYEFAGWSLEDGGEVLYVDQAELDDIKASTELKLFAAWTPNQYQVLFLSNDKEYSKYNGNVDSVVICPSINPTLDGYNFLGWYYFQLTADKTFDQNKTYYNVDGSIASVVAGTEVSGSYYEKVSLDANTTIPVNGLVLYAAFEANNYTVKFNANGGVGEIANQNASYNEEFVLSTNSFTREGYTFQGWSLTANGQLTYANEAKVMNLTSETEVELFAVWAANQYTISFFGNGGEVDGSHSINVTYDQPYGELPTANKAGYTFVGWFTSATDGLEVKAEDLVKILSNVDLYAHYATGNSSYVIEFHTEDFEGNYALDESLTQTKSGLTDSTVTLELDKLDAITGFSPVHHDNEKLSGEINASGNLKLIVFLSRNSYDITFRSNLDNEIVYQTQALYQSKVLYPQALAKKGYSYAVYNGLEEVYNSLDQSSTDVVVLANTELNVKYTPNTYTVIFNKGLSGDVVTGEMENQTFTFDKEQQLSKNAFALTGYNFLGWSTSTSGEVLYQDMASVSNLAYEGTITLYAKWSKAKFAISFDTKGGSPIETITEDYETMILEPTLPTKNGYEFDGWFDENDNAVLFPITVPSYDINLYVKWKTVTYHIVYSLNGGSLEEDNVESYNIESASFTLNNPTKEGYSFAGWTGTGLQTAQLEVTVSSGSTGSRNYTANFVANNYTIKFNGNGHTNNGKMLLQRMTYDTEEKLSATKFERIGYTFQGWALSADGEVLYGDQTKVSNLTAKADETVILYAVWKQNVYTIAFNKNNIKATGSMSGQTFTYEEEKALSLNEYSLTGYTFIGWALDSDGEVVYTDGEVVKQLTTSPDGSINLNAIWQANDDTPYVVNHYQQNANDSEYTLVSHLELEGTSDAIVKPEVNQYDGFTSPDEVEVVILPDGSLVVEYRYVRIRYNIKFDSNGGTSVQTINSKYGANVTQPADPTKVGYTFVSWDVEFPETMPLGGLELTALWQINQYTINFKLEDDAEEYYASIEQDYNTSVTSPLDPTKTGYLFAGWSQDVPETMPAQDLLLVATWTPIEYVVKFNGNGNTNNITMNDATYTYDLEAELSTNLYAKTGYTFLGWSTNSDATEAEYADEEEVLNLLDTNNASMTLYAVWTVNHYQVNFNGNGNTNEASMAAMTLAYDEAANLTANTFTKLGYTFLGWSTNSNATEADFADEDSISKLNPNDEAVVNLYAVWSINTYYINYVLNGGSLSEGIDNPTSYDVLTAITLPSPTKTGYTFTGWLDEASELATSVPAGSIGDRSFEATWTLNNPNIEFVGSYIINKTYDGNKVTLTVLASHPLSETYELSYQWYKGSDTIDGANTTSLELLNNAHSGSYYCVVTITDGTQTKDSQTPVAEISIAKKALTITADAKSKTYGEEDPALTYTSSGLVSGDAITGSLTREAGNDADTYDILQGTLSAGNNYEISYTKATFTINKKALTVTAQDKEVTYGDAIPAYTVSYNGFILGEDETVLDGELAFECTYVQYADVNTYTITPKGLTSDNYEISFVAGTLTVSQKEVGLSWSTDPLTYNGQAKAPTATATGLVNGDEIAVTVSGAGINAGDYTATATALTGDKAANYKLPTLVTKEYSIGKTDITLTLSLTGWTYGSTKNSPVLTGNAGNGSVTYQYKLKGADDSTYTTTVPTNAGNYVVKATVLETANYNGGSKTSEFAIAKKALTITADAKSKTYGEEDPALTYTSSGLVSGDAITGSLTREAGNDADTYDILQGTLSAGNNYEISYTKATFTINKKALTVTAQNKEVTYGDAIPAYTVSYNGFILGEDEADLDGTLAFECTYVQYADVNTYTITPKGLTSDNYEISFVAGTLTVSQKEVTINWGSDGDFYNGATQTTTASFQDVHGNNQDLVVGNTSSKDAGEYTLTASGLSANYKATLTHKYTINKVALTVTADAKAKTYGQSDPALTYQITSGALVGSETLSGALAREAGNNAGTYAINQGTLQASNNYTLAFVGANLVINKADINASVAATAADYTGSNITPTLTTTTATTVNNMTASWYFGTDGLNYGEKDVLPQFSAAGVHTIYYKVCADNHNDLTGSFSFTINYVVTFVSAGHGTVDTTVGRTSNDQFAFTRVTTPATGYHFVNFTVSGGSATISGATISNIDDNVTVTANFAANTYTITFNGNKGEGSSDVALDADTKVVTYDALLSGSVLKATRDGYTFTGWYTSDGTKLINVAATAWNFVNQEGYVENNTWKYAGDITLYAGWEALDYVVSFDANKATGSTGAVAQMDDIDVTFNGTYGTLPNPTRNGYAFAGWYLTSACNNEDLVEATSSVLTAANHTLYAKWVKSGYVSYTVEHYQQNIIDDNYTLADTDVIDNQQADTLTKGIAKVYVGFEEANSFSQINIDADGNNNVVKIYYNRQVKTLNFISNDTSVHANVSNDYRYGYQLTSTAFLDQDGYDYTISVTLPLTVEDDLDIDVTYVTRERAIRLYANNGTQAYVDIKEEYDVDVTISNAYDLVRTGYTFDGWNTKADGTGTAYSSGSVIKMPVDGLNLYAKWVLNAPEITTQPVAYEGTYDGVGTTLSVVASHPLSDTYNLTYAWYKDSILIPGETTNSLELVDVNASGDYKCVVSISDGTQNKQTTSSEVKVTILQKALTITANNKTITYGDLPTNAGVTYTGLVAGDTLSGTLSYDYDYVQFGNVGTSDITPSGLSNDNYDITFAPGTLTVSPKEVTLEWNTTTFTYDGTTKVPTLTVSGTVNNEVLGATITGGQKNAGNYTATVSELTGEKALNYQLPAANTHQFTINKVTLSVTADNKSVIYGEEAPTYTVTITGFVNNEDKSVLTEMPIATSAYVAGTTGVSSLDITCSGGSATNYSFEYHKGTLTVEKADPTFTAPSAKSLTYNGQAQELVNAGSSSHGTFEYKLGDGEWSTSLPSATSAQDYAVSWRLVGDNNHNDVENISISNVKINKAALTITADAKAKTYGEADPELTYTASGLVGSDTITGSLSRAAGNNVGTYDILQGTLSAGDNYEITYTKATFTINKKALNITAVAKAKTYGESDPELTYTSSGLVGNDTITGSLTREAGNNAGSYDILQGTLSAGNNYEITYTKATFTINKKTLTVTADAKSKTYGEEDPELTYTSSGLVGSDTITGSLTRETGDDADTYDILQGTLSAGNNYEISYTKATFTINKKALSITAKDKTIKYGQGGANDGINEYTLIGSDSLTGTLSFTYKHNDKTTAYVAGDNVGSYLIVPSGLSNDNYDITFVAGTLTVEAATLTLAWSNLTPTYTGSALAPTVSIASGKFGTDDVTVSTTATLTVVSSTTATATLGGAKAGNYAISNPTATFAVQKADPTFTAPSAKSLTYNGQAQELVNAGSSSHGTFEYKLGDGEWSTSLPSATNALGYTVSWRLVGDNNHNDVENTSISNVMISPKALTITAKDMTIKYGQDGSNDGINEYTLIGSDSLTGTLSFTYKHNDKTTAYVAGDNVGSYLIVPSGLSNDNYDITFVAGTLNVEEATLTLAWSDLEPTYTGSALAPTVSISSGKFGTDDVTVSTATTLTNYGSTTAEATLSGTKASNYVIANPTATFSVQKASITPVISIEGWTFGQTAKTPTVSGNSGNGGLTWSYKVKGTADSTYTTTVPTNAGEYTVRVVVAETTNYLSGSATKDFVISKAEINLTITLAGWTYGETANTPTVSGNSGNGGLTWSYKAKGADDSTYTTTVPTNAGDYTVKVLVAETANYQSGTATKDLTVAKANPTFTAPSAKSLTYNGQAQELVNAGSSSHGTFEYKLGDGEWSTSLPSATNALGYTVSWRLVGDNNHNDVENTSISNVKISKAALTITALAKAKTYGESDPELTYTITNGELFGSDLLDGELARESGDNAGTYDILQGSLSAGNNYEISYTKATFTINKKALNITAVAKAKTYGESDPELTYTSSGLVGNDTITGSLTRETGDNVGSYDILQGTLSAGNNYEISYTKASFTINKATLTVTADAKQVTYGADAPAFTNQITGYAEGDDESVITGNVSYTCSYTSTSVSAEYAITVSGNLTADNYDFNYVAGKLTVNAIISYNANGGSGSMTATVGLTPEVVNSTFANSGKHFAGWYTSYLFETKVEVGTKVNVNTELYAKWEANQVTVVLNGNGENSTTGSAKATYGASSLSNLVHATREGYTLVGYYTAFEDGIKVLNANGNFVNSDVAGYITNGKWSNLEDHNGTVTLYAIWEKTGHIIRYYRGAGDLIMTNGYDNGADVTLSFIPSKVGYTFVGWNTEADGTGTPYSSNGTIENLSSDMTLFAQWTANVLTVSYIKGNEDATGTMSETTEISYDMALTGNYSFAECAFELSGNVFNGWVKDNGVALTANGILELLQNGDAETKLQARWIPSPTIKYTVEHYFETASGYEINDEKTQEYLGYDKQFVVAEPIEVDGYYYDSSIQGTVNSGRIVSNGSLVLKLYYSIIGHTITFDTNGGSQISDMYLGEGSSIVVPTPTKVGYTFTGWTYYQLISEEFVETSALTLMPDTDLKLVANWSINTYKVTYYLTIDNVNYEGYESHYDASKNALVFEYEFGATVDAAPVVRNSSNNTPDSWSKTLTTMPAEDVSIYAYWPIVSYHLTMNYLEVVNDEVVDTIYHDLYLAEGSNLDRYFHPEKAGYSFDERRFFKTTDTEIQVKTYYLYDLETASFVEVSTPEYAKLNQYYELFVLENMPSYNIELFVAASPETYNIKYYDKTTDSEVVSDKEYFVLVNNSFELVENPDAENLGNYYQLTTVSNINYNDSIALASPEREGYKFGGWNEIGKGNYYLGGQTIIVNNNIVLVAEWSQQEYTIIFTDGFGNEIGQINGASSQGFMDYIAYLDTQISDLANICALPAYAIALYLMGDTTGVANLMFMGYEKYCPGMYDYVKKNGSEALTTLINYINTQNANLLGDADFISTIPGKMIQAIMYASSSDQTIMMTGINTLLSIDTTAYGYVLYADLINAVKAAVMSGNTTNIGAACAALYTDIATNINYFAGTLADHLSDAIQQGGLIDVLPDSVYYLYISDIQLTDGSTVIKYIDLFRRYNSYAGGANGDLINDFASDSMAVKYRLFTEYSDNAYYPTRNGCIFDHWTMSKSGNTITYTAQWRYQLEEPTNVRVENIKKQSVEFTWDEVSEANGYRVTYTIKGGTKQVVDVVSNNITIEIENGQSINLSVIALGNPEYLLLQNEYNGNTVTAIESFKLNSESSVEVEYVHNANTEDFDVSASGQYYYYDASTESYLLFASQSYNFGSKEIEKISDPNGVANIQENNGTYFILTGTKTGTFEFKVSDGKTVNYYKATVQPLVQSIVSTGSFRTYEKNYDNSSLGMDNATFIHQSENGYQVGVSNDNYDNGFSRTINGNSYKNGFYLDIIATTTSGINKAIDYEVVVMDSAENIVDCYYYDYEQNVIYFAEEAAGNTYTITVRPKQDSDDYINTQIPKARKNSNLLNYSFDVVVNNGVNVYTDEQLKKYYEDLSISEINIHSDIVAKLSPTMLGYYQYLIDNNTGLLGTGGGHYIGDVDTVHDFCELNVKNGTAVMIRVPKDASGNKIKDYGPAIWTTNGTGSPVFTDRNGTGWYYDRTNGDYAILSCDWEVVERKSAEDAHGTFKILNLASDYYEEAEAASLKLAFVYQRAMGKADSDEANNVTINGNYFNIDASKLPFLNSSGLVSVGGLIAAYDIQNVQVSIFGAFYLDAEKVTYDEDGKWSTSIPENSLNVTFNDLSIEGNTMNISEWLSDNNSTSVSSIAEYMKKTSSGYCGIKAEEKWMQNNLPTYPLVNLVTNNVAIKNTTIGLYTLRGSNLIANYTHVSQSWANGLDGNSSNNHELNYCKIETSGGGATHLEDFYITPENHENMNVKIDYHFTTITNWIAGDEQWFKAYGTAVMALGMKSALEAGMHQVKIPNLCPNGLTIIETFKDSLTGQDVEKMNLIAMGKLAVKDVNNYVSTDIIGDKGGYGAGDAQVEFTWYDEYDQPYQLLYDASSLGLGKIYRNTTYTKFILVVLKDVGSDKMYIVIEASPIK